MSLSATLIGFFLGFAFGVGCALAVLYSIYMGGYRAAVRDGIQPDPPPRLTQARTAALRKLPPTPTPTPPGTPRADPVVKD